MTLKTEVKWWLKWKKYLFIRNLLHMTRSPKTYLYICFVLILYGIILGSYWTFYTSVLFLIIFSVWLDFKRGVPRKWKYMQMTLDYKKSKEGEMKND